MTINRDAHAILANTPARAQLDADAERRATRPTRAVRAARVAPYAVGDAIHITTERGTTLHTVQIVIDKDDRWSIRTTAGYLSVNDDGSSRKPGTSVVKHDPSNPNNPAPRGWSRYSRPQGICQYCGAPCADTPSPTCTDC